MAKLLANCGDPDKTLLSAASDLGLHCLPITLLRVSRLQWVKLHFYEVKLGFTRVCIIFLISARTQSMF